MCLTFTRAVADIGIFFLHYSIFLPSFNLFFFHHIQCKYSSSIRTRSPSSRLFTLVKNGYVWISVCCVATMGVALGGTVHNQVHTVDWWLPDTCCSVLYCYPKILLIGRLQGHAVRLPFFYCETMFKVKSFNSWGSIN